MPNEPASGPDADLNSPSPGPPRSTGAAQVHDRYFRAALQGRAEQAALIGALFPTVAPLLEIDGVSPLDGTFVDDDLTQRQTDLVLRARLAGRDVIVYVLIEHQSTVDPLMAIRMLRYQLRIWDRYVRQHRGTTTVPAILPAVIYQGHRPWTAPTDIREVLDLDPETTAELSEQLPRVPYRLDDLAQLDINALRQRPLTTPLRVMLLLLSRAPNHPNLLGFLATLSDDFVEVAAEPHGDRHLLAAFTYIVNVSDISTEQLHPFANRLGPVAQEALMTTAEKLRAEGRAQGEALGRTQGEASLLLEQLTVRFGPQPADVQSLVRAASSRQLHTWARRILTATSVDDVLG